MYIIKRCTLLLLPLSDHRHLVDYPVTVFGVRSKSSIITNEVCVAHNFLHDANKTIGLFKLIYSSLLNESLLSTAATGACRLF